MARIDDLVAQIPEKVLRQKLEAALTDMKRRQRFGLVFEEHIPETTTLFGLPVGVGSTVQRRSDPEQEQLYLVKAVSRTGRATIEPETGGDLEFAPTDDLLLVKRFGDPIFPALTSVGSVRRGPKSKPHHAVINGENFHALQLLIYLYEGQVDCIYIDPPYNTGARDWKYNNHYVDKKDAWQHEPANSSSPRAVTCRGAQDEPVRDPRRLQRRRHPRHRQRQGTRPLRPRQSRLRKPRRSPIVIPVVMEV